MKIILPWLQKFATDPKNIQKLIEARAIEDWYAEHSFRSSNRKPDVATSRFILNEKRRIRQFISRLSDLEQVIAYLRYWENLLAREISEVIGVSENRIHLILKEIITKLRGFYIFELCHLESRGAV